jgi:hypothetical protein
MVRPVAAEPLEWLVDEVGREAFGQTRVADRGCGDGDAGVADRADAGGWDARRRRVLRRLHR